jgi:hypothetical protein
MPLLSIFFLIFILANSGTPLTLNFVGEFLCLYGGFERLPLIGALAASSIVLSAAYSVYLFNRVVFGGSFSLFFKENIYDLTKREFLILFILAFFTVLFGVYPSFMLDGLHYSVSSLIYGVIEISSYSDNVVTEYAAGVLPIITKSYSTRPRDNSKQILGGEKLTDFPAPSNQTLLSVGVPPKINNQSSEDFVEWFRGFSDAEGCFLFLLGQLKFYLNLK